MPEAMEDLNYVIFSMNYFLSLMRTTYRYNICWYWIRIGIPKVIFLILTTLIVFSVVDKMQWDQNKTAKQDQENQTKLATREV